ncbi:MAG: acyl-CoA desaturase [Woeseiaceae bacterium]|nr:acyl-CoA desaturase [Woeseiaceae bacterium]
MRPGVFRVDEESGNPLKGHVRWAPGKSLWIGTCLVVFAAAAPFATTLSAVLVFAVSTYITLLLGHSVGMHRMLIHRTWDGPLWLKRFLVYLGTLVGMAGPSGVIRIHDVRDWAQRRPDCHDFFSHRASFLRDAMWQLHCRFEFDEEPDVIVEEEVRDDPFYRFLDATWPLQQLPLGAVLFFIGGWPWVVWGVFGRVFVSVAGHWTVTYLTHNPGPGKWLIPDAGVQASNLRGFGFLTMGECWHNNHHAFPESARIGLSDDETDPGWTIIAWLERVGLAWDVGRPRGVCARGDLLDVEPSTGPGRS